MIRNILQFIAGIILFLIFAFLIVFIFNPNNLRNDLIGGSINNYLINNIADYQPIAPIDPDDNTNPDDKHPILNADQEATLEKFGVDVSLLPTSVSPEMEACFVDKLGQSRVDEIIGGATPNAIDIFRAKSCL